MGAESTTALPQWNFTDERLRRLCQEAWGRLPQEVRGRSVLYIQKVSDDWNWSQSNNVSTTGSCYQKVFAKFNPYSKHIQFSRKDCASISDNAIIGAFVHEVAHAFKTATVPDPTNPCYLDAIEHAGDALPSGWCFAKEIAALIVERVQS